MHRQVMEDIQNRLYMDEECLVWVKRKACIIQPGEISTVDVRMNTILHLNML